MWIGGGYRDCCSCICSCCVKLSIKSGEIFARPSLPVWYRCGMVWFFLYHFSERQTASQSQSESKSLIFWCRMPFPILDSKRLIAVHHALTEEESWHFCLGKHVFMRSKLLLQYGPCSAGTTAPCYSICVISLHLFLPCLKLCSAFCPAIQLFLSSVSWPCIFLLPGLDVYLEKY